MAPLFLLALAAAAVYFMTKDPAYSGEKKMSFPQEMLEAYRGATSNGIPFWFVYSVASHESNAGQGNAYKKSRNAFSIHAGAGDGKPNNYWRGAVWTTSHGEVLRVYAKLSDAISDFCLLVATRPWLQNTYGAVTSGNHAAAYEALELSGYAGKPATGYARALARREGEISA